MKKQHNIDIESVAKGLRSEAKWLNDASDKAKGFHPEYIKGFKSAAGWVRFHGENTHLLIDREYDDPSN